MENKEFQFKGATLGGFPNAFCQHSVDVVKYSIDSNGHTSRV